MHFGIFAERFLPRYGADRVCLILAELLEKQGHRVTLVGVRFADSVLERFANHTIRVPAFAGRMAQEQTARWWHEHAYYFARHLPPFDVSVVTSFPFITAIPNLRRQAAVVFFDFGAVPVYGYPRHIVRMITRMQHSRRRCLRFASAVVAISKFIAESQSVPDSQGVPLVESVLLGADHLVQERDRDAHGLSDADERALQEIDKLASKGRRLVLCLGRWEPHCYKNSPAAYDILKRVVHQEPDALMMVLGHANEIDTPECLKRHVHAIGFPSDRCLYEIIKRVDAGLSVSRWEGFNLPLVELQYMGKPAFAFAIGAHPEVVVTNDQLAGDVAEMSTKVLGTVRNYCDAAWTPPESLKEWQKKFTWQRFGQDFIRVVERVA